MGHMAQTIAKVKNQTKYHKYMDDPWCCLHWKFKLVTPLKSWLGLKIIKGNLLPSRHKIVPCVKETSNVAGNITNKCLFYVAVDYAHWVLVKYTLQRNKILLLMLIGNYII